MKKFVLDNGAFLAKAGYSTDSSSKYFIKRFCFRYFNLEITFRCIPNYVTKSKNGRETFVGG